MSSDFHLLHLLAKSQKADYKSAQVWRIFGPIFPVTDLITGNQNKKNLFSFCK